MTDSPTFTVDQSDLVLCNNTTIEAYFTGVPSGWTAGALGSGPSVDSFTESFSASPLAAPWYDDAATSFKVGTNPDDASNCYEYEWLNGESNSPLSQTARRKITATDTIDISFDTWIDTAAIVSDNDHAIYVRLNTSGDYDGLSVGNGFTLYVQPEADGQTEVEWRLADDSTWRSDVTTGAPSWKSANPRTIRVIAQMNTLGSSDGRLRVFVDGTQYIDLTDCVFRQNSGEQFEQIIIAPELKTTQTSDVSMHIDSMSVDSSYSFATAEFPYDSSRSIAAQAKFVAATGGSDSNDGSIGSPWATINASLPKLVAGDTLYLRGGTHSVSSYNFRFNVNDGTAGSYITVTSYPGEEPVVDCGGSSWINMDLSDYWQFTNFKVIDYVTAFDCAENAPYPQSPKFISLEGETAYGGDNVGFIKLRGGNDYEVDKIKVTLTVDPATVHQNTGGIYIIDSSGTGTGTLNRIETYNFRSGIYYKHGAGDLSSNTQHITVAKSAFFGSTRTAVGYNCEGVLFENCIFGTGFRLAEADGGEAGDWNWFDHCTFLGLPYLSSQNQSSQAGAKNNKFTNSIFNAGLRVGQLGSVTSDSDYNLFVPSSIEHTFIESPESSTSVDLAGWRTFNSSDANSVEGTPTFVGTGDVIANYALDTGSAGENASSTGTDIGADVTQVGVAA